MSLRIGKKRIVFAGKYLVVWEKEFFDKNGERRIWEYIERKRVIFIFPITFDQKVVLVRNFRVPLERYVIEVPAGLKDKINESDEEVARRELLEETGYCAEKLIPIKPFPYRQGSSNGIAVGFFAVGLKKVKESCGDETEDMTMIEVKMDKLMDFYRNLPQNELFDSQILSMYCLAVSMGICG